MNFILEKSILLLVLVMSVALHEFGHAAMTNRLGDPTARLQGRLTINPVVHFDPLGFFFTLMMVYVGFGFAWGKPVQTNPLYYPKYRQGIILVALAGPAMNLCLTMFGVALSYILFTAGVQVGWGLGVFLNALIIWNFVLMVFNLLPIPPLDGGHLLQQLAPRFMEPLVRFLQAFGFLVLLGLFYFGVLGFIIQIYLGIFFAVIDLGFGPDFGNFLRTGLQ